MIAFIMLALASAGQQACLPTRCPGAPRVLDRGAVGVVVVGVEDDLSGVLVLADHVAGDAALLAVPGVPLLSSALMVLVVLVMGAEREEPLQHRVAADGGLALQVENAH